MSQQLSFKETPLPGLVLVERKPVIDDRGFLSRLFCANEFKQTGFSESISQINHTLTKVKGTVRGMHFQPAPNSESKIISCTRGMVFDVAVDVRKGSDTFLQWHGEILSADNHASLYIPDGFAHGFQALTDDCELIYFHTSYYAPNIELALNAKDPMLAIEWPLDITHTSARDAGHPMLDHDFKGI